VLLNTYNIHCIFIIIRPYKREPEVIGAIDSI